jgi:hypothetical protein
MKYVYEYGHRWNPKLPRYDMHCMTPDSVVQETIRQRCE